MTVYYSEILDRIYATSGLSTLSPGSQAALLHPDYAEALTLLVRDVAGALIAGVPRAIVSNIILGDESIQITFAANTDNDDIAKASFISAVTTLVLAQIKIAASSDPDAILSLVRLLPSLSSAVTNAVTPPVAPARIRPCY